MSCSVQCPLEDTPRRYGKYGISSGVRKTVSVVCQESATPLIVFILTSNQIVKNAVEKHLPLQLTKQTTKDAIELCNYDRSIFIAATWCSM